MKLTERLGTLLELTPQSRVLDIASGKGTSALFLAERFGCEVLGIDYSRLLSAAGEAWEAGAARAPWTLRSGRRLAKDLSRNGLAGRPFSSRFRVTFLHGISPDTTLKLQHFLRAYNHPNATLRSWRTAMALNCPRCGLANPSTASPEKPCVRPALLFSAPA